MSNEAYPRERERCEAFATLVAVRLLAVLGEPR